MATSVAGDTQHTADGWCYALDTAHQNMRDLVLGAVGTEHDAPDEIKAHSEAWASYDELLRQARMVRYAFDQWAWAAHQLKQGVPASEIEWPRVQSVGGSR